VSKRFQWLLLGGLLTIALLAAVSVGSPRADEQVSQAPTTYSPLPYGTKAFFMAIERLGYKPRRWRLEWSRLKNEKGILIYAPADPLTAAGSYRALSPSAAREAGQWVERGNTLLYFMSANERERQRNLLFEQFEITVDMETLPPDSRRTQSLRQFLPVRLERDFDNLLPAPWMAGVRRLTSDAVPGMRVQPGHSVVLADKPDRGHVSLIPYGSGRVYLFSSAGFMDNYFIGRSDNLTLLLDILERERGKNGVVLFDEFHHGFSAEFGASHFVGLPVVRFAALQAVILAVLFVVTSWRRFGKPLPLVRDTRRSIREYTRSLGNLYFRARAHREGLGFLFQQLHHSLCSRYNLPDNVSHSVVEDKLRIQLGAPKAWNELAGDCERLLAKRRIADRELLAVSQKMEAFRKLIA
jgi:hypothetical protein